MIDVRFPPDHPGLTGTSSAGSNSQQRYTSSQECELVRVLRPLQTVACSESRVGRLCVKNPHFSSLSSHGFDYTPLRRCYMISLA